MDASGLCDLFFLDCILSCSSLYFLYSLLGTPIINSKTFHGLLLYVLSSFSYLLFYIFVLFSGKFLIFNAVMNFKILTTSFHFQGLLLLADGVLLTSCPVLWMQYFLTSHRLVSVYKALFYSFYSLLFWYFIFILEAFLICLEILGWLLFKKIIETFY